MDDSIVSSSCRSRKSCNGKKDTRIDASVLASQRPMWDALKKSINGLVNKVTVSDVRNVAKELLSENIIWGRGLFCSAILKSSVASNTLVPVLAALVAVINSRYPDVGYLLIKRVVNQLMIACKRNDKHRSLPLVNLLSHLVNQGVVHELLALELLYVLLHDPTNDSTEVSVFLVQQCGSAVHEGTPRGLNAVFERLREILRKGKMDKRTERLIEGLFATRRSRFSGYPAVCPELDIVLLGDQVKHEISLCNEMDPEMSLDVFSPDPRLLMTDDERHKVLKAIVLGEEDNKEDANDEFAECTIEDETETDLVNLRRTIFLTMMSGFDFEDAGHKLLSIPLRPNQEVELCNMLLECCSSQKSYNRYFTLVAQRLCLLNKVYCQKFENCFVLQYSSVHRLEIYKLHNVAKFFAHLLSSDSLTWHILAYIRLTLEDTNPSSRIFIKILFQELSEELGVHLLNKRLNDPTILGSLESIFPKDNSENLSFSINFFTAIGLGGLTKNMREFLENMQKQNQVSRSDEETRSFNTSGPGAASSRLELELLKSQQSDHSRRHGKRRRST